MPSYVYHYYTDDRSNTVFGYKSPPAYLIDKHVYGGLCLLQPNVGNAVPTYHVDVDITSYYMATGK